MVEMWTLSSTWSMLSFATSRRVVLNPLECSSWTLFPVSMTTLEKPQHFQRAPFETMQIESCKAKNVGYNAMSCDGLFFEETTTILMPSNWLFAPAPSLTPIFFLINLVKCFVLFVTNMLAPLSTHNNTLCIISGDNPWTGLRSLPACHGQNNRQP